MEEKIEAKALLSSLMLNPYFRIATILMNACYAGEHDWKGLWNEITHDEMRIAGSTKKVKIITALKDAGYDSIFKELIEKNWYYGIHPQRKSALGWDTTLRQKLDSRLITKCFEAYLKTKHIKDQYGWMLSEMNKFQFYLCDDIRNGTAVYNGADLSTYTILTRVNLCDLLLKKHRIPIITANEKDKEMVLRFNIDGSEKYNYNRQLVFEVDDVEISKYFINTIGQDALVKAFDKTVRSILSLQI